MDNTSRETINCVSAVTVFLTFLVLLLCYLLPATNNVESSQTAIGCLCILTFIASCYSLSFFMNSAYYLYSKFFKSVPNCAFTTKAVIATLSDYRQWKEENGVLIHKSGLKLTISDNRAKAFGLFSCTFNEKESLQINKAVDIMQSSKLTNQLMLEDVINEQ